MAAFHHHLQPTDSHLMLLPITSSSSSSSCKFPFSFTFHFSAHLSLLPSPKQLTTLHPKSLVGPNSIITCGFYPSSSPDAWPGSKTLSCTNEGSVQQQRQTKGYVGSATWIRHCHSHGSCEGSVVEERSRERYNSRKPGGQNGSGISSRRLNQDDGGGAKMEGSSGEGRRRYDDKDRRERGKGKGLKKKSKLEIRLNRYSKMGDVIGAIELYDSAVRAGIKIGLHQYTRLLYLCSSAAMGEIHRAKQVSFCSRKSTICVTTYNEASLASQDNDDDDDDEDDDEDGDLDEDVVDDCKDLSREMGSDEILVSEEVKKYALEKGLEIYKNMCSENIPLNEAALTSVARMALVMGDGDMAFDMVKKMKELGLIPRLQSYVPALLAYCSSGKIDEAFAVEKHMLDHDAVPEEPELAALLRLSIDARKADKVYYVLHKLRVNVRSVSPSTAELVKKWFKSTTASRVGKRKWDPKKIADVMESVGGGWHGQGWLGSGKWTVSRATIAADGVCKCCGEKLALIDLDPEETERFAESVASIARRSEKHSSFEKFQKWLDYYGPFEAVIDAANVGLYNRKTFAPSRVNAVASEIRSTLQSAKWPLIVLHNRHISGHKLSKPAHKVVVERWKTADALYATPTGSNDDWYWLYAAIKFKCFLVTNDEMRDHIFQLLGNDFFPKWKERHQVKFSFTDIGPVIHLLPLYSVVIQESERGHWHIPVGMQDDALEQERTWLCITRSRNMERGSNATAKPEERVDNAKEDTTKSNSRAARDTLRRLREILLHQ